MFDTHYDLLTLVYMAKHENKNINHLLNSFNPSNVLGVISNLYFQSEKEMAEELKYPAQINVLKMFKEAKETLESYHPNTKILYSIEGCDYIKDTKELEELFKAGLNSIILVWNEPNKYGSGYRTNKGLTKEGRIFIQKAIDLGLGIDLSHANEATFNGIIKEIKKAQAQNKKVTCYASHSDINHLYNHPRNLNDKQLKQLKEVGGKLGLVAYPKFLTDKTNLKDIRKAYIEHICYAVNAMGIDNVMLASDNMSFINEFDTAYKPVKPAYEYNKMKEEIEKDLTPYFNQNQINKIMCENAKQLYFNLKQKN